MASTRLLSGAIVPALRRLSGLALIAVCPTLAAAEEAPPPAEAGVELAPEAVAALIAPQRLSIVLPAAPVTLPLALPLTATPSANPLRFGSRVLGYANMLSPGCGLAPLRATGARGASDCPFADLSTGVALTTSLLPFESRVMLVRGTRSPWTSTSLLTRAPTGWSDESSAALIGFTANLFDGRLRVSNDFALAETWQAPVAAADYSPLKRDARHATARWLRIEGKAIDKPGFSWTLAADYGSVGSDFPIDQAFLLERSWIMPGSRLNLSSVVKFGGSRLALSTDTFDSDYGRSTTRRIGFGRDGWSIGLALRDYELRTSSLLGLSDMHTVATTATLDLDPGTANSGLLARLGQSPLVPRNVSLMLRWGTDEYGLSTGFNRYDRRSWDATATWETRLGETTLGYSADRRRGIGATPGDRAVNTVQFEHVVRRGGWRLGGDVMVSSSSDTGSTGFDDRTTTFGAVLAYQRNNGPEFRLRVGRDQTRLRLNDRSYLSDDRGMQISASLDLSRYLQKRFGRDDLRLRAEFRKSLLDSTELFPDLDPFGFEPLQQRRDRNVFQLSFGMRL